MGSNAAANRPRARRAGPGGAPLPGAPPAVPMDSLYNIPIFREKCAYPPIFTEILWNAPDFRKIARRVIVKSAVRHSKFT